MRTLPVRTSSREAPTRGPRLGKCAAALRTAAVLVAAACIQVVQTAPPQEPEPRTPDPFVSLEEPKLQPTDIPGLFSAPSLDETVYYYKPNELWYRYAFRRWYQAFRWDGAWFVPEKVPEVIVARGPKETPQTVKERVRDLDRKLETLDREEKLKELENKMKELDKQDAKGASPSTPATPTTPAGSKPEESPPKQRPPTSTPPK